MILIQNLALALLLFQEFHFEFQLQTKKSRSDNVFLIVDQEFSDLDMASDSIQLARFGLEV